MKQRPTYFKVAADMFSEQLKWSLWFVSFVLVAHIVFMIIAANIGDVIVDFVLFSQGSSKIYMLILGILSAYVFLTWYANHGVTRKEYFISTALSAAGLSVALVILAIVIAGLEYLILGMADMTGLINNALADNSIQSADNSISISVPEAVAGSSALMNGGSWFVSLLMYALSIFTYYVIGWMIGAGYYRFGWIAGFGFIAMAIVFVAIADFLLGALLFNWLPLSSMNLSILIAIIGYIIVIGINLWIIRFTTRKTPIKM